MQEPFQVPFYLLVARGQVAWTTRSEGVAKAWLHKSEDQDYEHWVFVVTKGYPWGGPGV